jgi:hypothetical protein
MPYGLPYPIFGASWRWAFALRKNDGTLITGAAGLDSEVSIDAAGFGDCTDEAHEIATNSGHYYIDLTGAELSGSAIAVQVKTSSSGAVIPSATLYPRRMPTLRSGTAAGGANGSITLDSGASAVDDYYNGCIVLLTNNTPGGAQYQARVILDYDGASKVATILPNWSTNPSSSTTFTVLAPIEWQMANLTRTILALPAAAPGASGGLIPIGTGAGAVNVGTGVLDVNAEAVATAVLAATVDMPGTVDKTVSQVLQAAWAQGAGKWVMSGTTLTLYAPDGTTPVAAFTLNSATAPTTRTPTA